MIKKILKWTGLIILLLVTGISATVASRQHLQYEAPYPSIKASKDTAVIARGRHLVLGPANCVACHSTAKNADSLIHAGAEVPLSGGFQFKFALGTFYTPNITSDATTGIGRFTDGELARILRYNVHKNGEMVLPFMDFQNMCDEDVRAVISYLRTTKPVHNVVPGHEVSLMGNVVKAFLMKPGHPADDVPKNVQPDSTAAYGKYLVTNIAHCGHCHTKRDESGNLIGADLAGGSPMARPGSTVMLTPPNLTTDSSSRIFGWSQHDFIKRFRMGRLNPNSEMPWTSLGNMTDTELKAVYAYLKTLKPAKTDLAKP